MQRLGLSLLTGALLTAAWPMAPFTLLIYIAFVPLLILSDNIEKPRSFWGFTFIAMLCWNACTTWWMWNSTGVGSVAAIIANSLIMTLPWWGYFSFKKRYSSNFALLMLVLFWLSFEYVHLNWELSWPWLTLGNVFANYPSHIQWYEYTGVGGGSLLILLMNVLVYRLTKEIIAKAPTNKILIHGLLTALLPVSVSFLNQYIYAKADAAKSADNVVIVQPNIDPYQKFELSTAAQQIRQLIALSESAADSNTRLVIWPETAMSVAEWQHQIPQNQYYQPVFEFTQKHPGLTLVSGIETFKNYGTTKATPTAHEAENSTYYDAFNAAIAIQTGQPLQLYNKSKLVPGVESLPSFLRIMAPLFEQFGGSTGGYGRSDSAGVFSNPGNRYVAAPIICYESIYGEYVASYVTRGANILTVITNDGWWGNTPGHRQHLAYARLRAIETRRWVARSANTGISAVINEYGEIVEQRGWDQPATIKYAIPVRTERSFYVQHGDYIFRYSLYITLLLTGFHVYLTIQRRLKKNG
ncbi:MAG TPA: apolipoprotein N-acyltransferase [Sediminibacterium sp.]|nr:apolipoprotein N-acyltransferase [Sediminibacterium sp.]